MAETPLLSLYAFPIAKAIRAGPGPRAGYQLTPALSQHCLQSKTHWVKVRSNKDFMIYSSPSSPPEIISQFTIVIHH